MKAVVLVVILAFMVSACETVAWQRAGTDQLTTDEDHRACRWEAQLRARRALTLSPQFLSRGSAAPVRCRHGYGRGSAFDNFGDCPIGVTGGRAMSSSSLFANQVVLENDFTRRCMRAKGYELVNIDEKSAENPQGAKEKN